jgi:bifunctional non-homologous end joining protein LigD
MLLLRTDALPSTAQWLYELKLDGYRAIDFKRQDTLHLRSRNNKDFGARYPAVAAGLAKLPDNTVIDGEIVAFDDEGRPSFNALQNFWSAPAPVVYYVFDVMVLTGRDVMRFEGLVAKRRNSIYEPGQRSGAWQKMRVNRGQEFVIGGYTRGGSTFDALIFGYSQANELIYVARTRNGFTPAVRRQLFKTFQPLLTDVCPFVNLPKAWSERSGEGPHQCQNRRVPVDAPSALGPVRVSGVDRRQPSTALQVRRPARGNREGRRGSDAPALNLGFNGRLKISRAAVGCRY